MALILEDGTMPAGANVYALVAMADQWYLDLNDLTWTALPIADKEKHLIIGCAYVSNQQIYPADGDRQSLTQWLSWPRTGATYWRTGPLIPDSTIVVDLIKANIVAAGLSANNELPTDLPGSGAGGIEVKKEKVDVIEVEYFHSTEGQADSAAASGAIGPGTIAAYGHPDVNGYMMPLIRDDAITEPDPTGGVTRDAAARRGAFYLPTDTPPSFTRGMMDASPLAEDVAMSNRGK